MVKYTEIVAANIEKVWAHLLYKVDSPQYFVPGVSNVQILEKDSNSTHRKMDVTMPDGSTHTVEEQITYQPYEVCFGLLNHPKYEGYVLNNAEAISPTHTELTYTMVWIDKQTKEPFLDSTLIEKAVKKSIEFILQPKS